MFKRTVTVIYTVIVITIICDNSQMYITQPTFKMLF